MRVGHLDIRELARWANRIDPKTRALIERKIDLLTDIGDAAQLPLVRRLGGGLSELRVGKHRLYFAVVMMESEDQIERGIMFVTYGEKGTQQRDIERARGRL
jgi:putative component of toxin-antitoxin plasmid stabilization module